MATAGSRPQSSGAAGSDPDKNCFHCGEPVPVGLDLFVRQKENGAVVGLPVCCPGCKSVAELIYKGGLGRYYRFRESLALRAAEDINHQATAWRAVDDRQALWGKSLGGGLREILIQTEGIHCQACAWLIRSHLERLDGVSAVNVDTGTGYTRINWSPDIISLSDLARALMELGYKPHLPVAGIEEQGRQAERRESLKRTGVAGLGMMQVMMYAVGLYAGETGGMTPAARSFLEWVSLLVTLPVLIYSGRVFYRGAINSLRARRPGMDVPVSLAISLAFIASCINFFRGSGEVWFDSVVMFIFFLSAGRHVELTLRHRNLQTATALARMLPEWAERKSASGWNVVPGMDLIPGDLVRVDAGQAFPADGKLLEATAQVNEALLSGESSPVVKRTHDTVTAGTVNLDQPVEFRVTAAGPETTISSLGRQLLSLQAPGTEAAGAGMGNAGLPVWLVPAFIISVLCLALLTGIGWQMVDSARAFPAMLAVLVASCPCALSLAIPATLSAASRNLISRGILMADSDALNRLRDIDHVVFDKTGTLTSGLLRISEVSINAQRKGLGEHSALSIAASMEAASTHPVALAIKEAASTRGLKHTALQEIEDLKIIPGQGVQGMWNGQTWRLGTADFSGVQAGNEPDSGTTEGIHPAFEDWNSDIWLADQEGWVARFRMSESLRPDALKIVDELRHRGLHLEILSGDGMSSVAEVADSLAIPDRAARQSAGDKLRHVQRLQAQGRRVLVVGDGVNDAPVLAAADVSMAVRGGADLANSVADFIFVTDSLDLIRIVLDTGRSTGQFTRQNLAWALIYNIGVMPLAVLAILQPWMAALGMSLSSLLVVGNASRLSGKS